MNTAALKLFDAFASEVLLLMGFFLVTVFVGWVYGCEATIELGTGLHQRFLAKYWFWHVRVVVLLAVLMTLVLSVASFAGGNLL